VVLVRNGESGLLIAYLQFGSPSLLMVRLVGFSIALRV